MAHQKSSAQVSRGASWGQIPLSKDLLCFRVNSNAANSPIRFGIIDSPPKLQILTLNIPSLARQRCLPSWGPRRTPWYFCNFSSVCCGRLLKLCFLGFWNYNSVIKALLAANILFIYFNRSNRGHGTSPHSLITHPASEQCHLLSIVGGPFFKFTTFRT